MVVSLPIPGGHTFATDTPFFRNQKPVPYIDVTVADL